MHPPPLPGRFELAAPYPRASALGRFFRCDISGRIAAKVQGPAFADDLVVQVLTTTWKNNRPSALDPVNGNRVRSDGNRHCHLGSSRQWG